MEAAAVVARAAVVGGHHRLSKATLGSPALLAEVVGTRSLAPSVVRLRSRDDDAISLNAKVTERLRTRLERRLRCERFLHHLCQAGGPFPFPYPFPIPFPFSGFHTINFSGRVVLFLLWLPPLLCDGLATMNNRGIILAAITAADPAIGANTQDLNALIGGKKAENARDALVKQHKIHKRAIQPHRGNWFLGPPPAPPEGAQADCTVHHHSGSQTYSFVLPCSPCRRCAAARAQYPARCAA